MITIRDIINISGGVENVARKCNLTIYAIRKWYESGIPQKYWEIILDLYNKSPETKKGTLTATGIFDANKSLKAT